MQYRRWTTGLIILAMLAGFMACTSAPEPEPKHPEDAIEFNGHWYKVFDSMESWHTKKQLCEAMGGYLCVIETEEEQKFITELADDRYLSLGATDEEEEGTWVWVNGAPFEYTAWMDGQPNNYADEEHYLATYDYGEWVDVAKEGQDFWMPTGYICEWEE
ncbi:MAG: lectin-like protein [Candidatus Sumerlaeia bacterium]